MKLSVLFAGILILDVSMVSAQAQPAAGAPPDPAIVAAAKRIVNAAVEVDDTVPPLTLALGGIKPGSGPAGGPAFGFMLADRSYVQVTGEYSLHNFKLLQIRFHSRPFAGRRVRFRSRLRWQDAPDLPIYPVGIDSPEGRAFYGERMTELSGDVTVRVSPHVDVSGGTGLERYVADGGHIDLSEDDSLPVVPRVPGLGTRPTFLHSHARASFDSRVVPAYDTSAWIAEAALHSYVGVAGQRFTFQQAHLGAEKIIVVFGGHGVVDATARLVASASASPNGVPFFLMPYLGGGEGLGGYRLYRFRDRDALTFSGEYRWPVHEYVDLAAFVESGTVAPRLGALTSGFRQDVGIGVRVHTAASALLTLDLVRGGEGVEFTIGF